MFHRDLTAEQLEEINEPFKIVSQPAMDYVADNAPDDLYLMVLFRLQARINFTTFTAASPRQLAKGTRYSKKRFAAGLLWLEELGLIERKEGDGETLWRFTEAFGYEGTSEKWREIKQRQDAH